MTPLTLARSHIVSQLLHGVNDEAAPKGDGEDEKGDQGRNYLDGYEKVDPNREPEEPPNEQEGLHTVRGLTTGGNGFANGKTNIF